MGRWFGYPAYEAGNKSQFEAAIVVLDELPVGNVVHSRPATRQSGRIVNDRLRRLG